MYLYVLLLVKKTQIEKKLLDREVGKCSYRRK